MRRRRVRCVSLASLPRTRSISAVATSANGGEKNKQGRAPGPHKGGPPPRGRGGAARGGGGEKTQPGAARGPAEGWGPGRGRGGCGRGGGGGRCGCRSRVGRPPLPAPAPFPPALPRP